RAVLLDGLRGSDQGARGARQERYRRPRPDHRVVREMGQAGGGRGVAAETAHLRGVERSASVVPTPRAGVEGSRHPVPLPGRAPPCSPPPSSTAAAALNWPPSASPSTTSFPTSKRATRPPTSPPRSACPR